MLNIWRRHLENCPHRRKGRAWVKCSCPIWTDGELRGRRVRQSLKLRDWQRAIKKLAEIENPDAPRPVAVKQACEAFLTHCRDLAEGTLRKYRNVMNHARAFWGEHLLSEVTVEDLNRYRAGRHIGRITALKELQTLRGFFSFCCDQGWLQGNPAKHVKPPKGLKPRPIEPYSVEEMNRILAACDQIGQGAYERKRARAMVLLLRYTGLRISDVATLQRDRIENAEIALYTQKTGGLVKLPLPPEVLGTLAELQPPRGARLGCAGYFWNGITSRRAVVGIAERTLSAVFRKAKVRSAHAHRFRHTLATDILAKGGTIQDAADILGISPAVAYRHYAKWSQDRQDRITGLMLSVQAGVNVRDERWKARVQ